MKPKFILKNPQILDMKAYYFNCEIIGLYNKELYVLDICNNGTVYAIGKTMRPIEWVYVPIEIRAKLQKMYPEIKIMQYSQEDILSLFKNDNLYCEIKVCNYGLNNQNGMWQCTTGYGDIKVTSFGSSMVEAMNNAYSKWINR